MSYDERRGPLSGYRVLDLTQYVSGPQCTMMLAELGAEVIKVEFGPRGDPCRNLPVIHEGRSSFFVQYNRGKKSVCLDLKTPDARQILQDLVAQCDVLVENGSPGVIARQGLGYEQARSINPRIIMCSISAFGQVGPLATAPGFDWCGGGYSGALSMIGPEGGAPTPPQVAIGDITTGIHAFGAVLAALLNRERGGEGQFIDISLLDSWFYFHDSSVAHASVAAAPENLRHPTRLGGRMPFAVPYGVYKGRDRYFAVLSSTDTHFNKMCEAMGKPELASDPRFADGKARAANWEAVKVVVEEWLQSMDNEAVLAAANAAHIPIAPILSVEEASEHPHLVQRGTVKRIADPVLGELNVPGFPLRMSAHPGLPLTCPTLGEHNESIISGMLGYSPDTLARLERDGILFSANP